MPAFDPFAFDPLAFDTGDDVAAIMRRDFRNAMFTILGDQKSATPTELRKVLRYRPGGMGGEKPIAWIGQIQHRLTYDAGTRYHTMSAEIVCATTFPADLIDDDDPFDDLLDALIERFTDQATPINNSVLTLNGIDDGEVSFVASDGATTIYRGATLSVGLQIWEGRQ